MANNIFEKYGIKEVADVTFYDTKTGKPVLFLDTLKVSTIEQTAEQVSARGGKGNPELIVWDYGKEITLNLEDALFSPQSMNLMLGGMDGEKLKNDLSNESTDIPTLTRMIKYEAPDSSKHITAVKADEKWYNPATMEELTDASAVNTILDTYKYAYCEKTYTKAGNTVGTVSGKKIEISAANFPGTYRVVGETYARSQNTGNDEYFQFEIPKAKMSAENTITLEAEGDPSVFNMTMKVLRPESGPMIVLRQYSLEDATESTASTTHTVTFALADGDTNITSVSAPAAATVEDGTKVTEPSDVTAASGYHIVWKNGDTTWNFTTDEVTADITLTAYAVED